MCELWSWLGKIASLQPDASARPSQVPLLGRLVEASVQAARHGTGLHRPARFVEPPEAARPRSRACLNEPSLSTANSQS
ncbi:unnamed protein product [Protopolystoma xenopodis]|uniref:Uncharacterized protein n=1 Tax=Protopolystoma xenopodis TaxID=117903 RepID=A0A448XQQ6_9PLAT|nr:unnamed protein product [Protopolystoma xenopodis]